MTAGARASRPRRARDDRAGPARSRRRGEALETAIRDAVLAQLIEQGTSGVTMEAVAARAGTSKPVLYRRWPDRAALLRDTLVPLAMAAIPHTDTGSYRGDMTAILRGWAAFFRSPQGVIASAVVGAMPHDPELAEAFRQGVIGWRKAAMAETIARGVSRGELRPDVRVDIARELGQAILWHRFLVTGDEITDELIEHIVDDILVPYAGAVDPAPEHEPRPSRRDGADPSRSGPAPAPPVRPARTASTTSSAAGTQRSATAERRHGGGAPR